MELAAEKSIFLLCVLKSTKVCADSIGAAAISPVSAQLESDFMMKLVLVNRPQGINRSSIAF